MSQIVSPLDGGTLPLALARGGATTRCPLGASAQCATDGGAITVQRPSPRVAGALFGVVDTGAMSASNPITVDGDGDLIDGAATCVISQNSAAAMFLYDGGQWRRLMTRRIVAGGIDLVEYAIDQFFAAALSPVVTGQTTWGSSTYGIICVEPPAPVPTTNATLTSLVAFPALAPSSMVDFLITIIGRRTGGASGAAGDAYRADFPCCYQRIGSAAPTLVGAAATETGKKSNGGGSAYVGSVDVVGNTIVAFGTGVATTNIDWTAVIQGQQVG